MRYQILNFKGRSRGEVQLLLLFYFCKKENVSVLLKEKINNFLLSKIGWSNPKLLSIYDDVC